MTELNDEKWMREALFLAKRAYDLGEVPIGAVVVSDEKIVGRGWNQPISAQDPTAHAEIVAIRDACKSLSNYRICDAVLYVTIEPCTMCYGALIHSRIRRVVFGATEPKAGVLQSHSHIQENQHIYNHQVESLGGVLGLRCSRLIQRFFRERRRAKKQSKRQAQP